MNRDPNYDEQLRERCLQMAIDARTGDPVQEAQRFFGFISGQDPKSPRQAILDALEAAGVR